MTQRPPTPQTPTTGPAVGAPDSNAEDRTVVTTTRIAAAVESAVGYRPKESDLDAVLLELDRNEFVECLGVTRTGAYAWDLSASPDRIADAIAKSANDRLVALIERKSNVDDRSA